MSVTHTTLEWPSVDVIAVKIADRIGGILVAIHLDESKATIGLPACLDYVAEVEEQRYQIVMRCVGREVTNIAGGLPLGGLLDHYIVRLGPLSRELMMTAK